MLRRLVDETKAHREVLKNSGSSHSLVRLRGAGSEHQMLFLNIEVDDSA